MEGLVGWWVRSCAVLLGDFLSGGLDPGVWFLGGVWTSSGGLSNAGFEILRLSFPLFHYSCIE